MQLKEVSPMRVTTQLRWRFLVPAFFVLAAVSLTAGGFYLSLEMPTNAHAQQAKDAVLLVESYGCHQPEHAVISASAEGFVKGQRETIELKLYPLSKGVYAIKRQWPAEGIWLVAVRGSYLGAHRSALLDLAPDGTVKIEKAGVSQVKLLGELTAADIDTRLRILVKERSANQQAWN